MKHSLRYAVSLAVLSYLGNNSTALAQENTVPVLTTGAVASTLSTAASGIEEIMVTATKKETNLQDTPIAISVVSTEMMQDRNIKSMLDFADGAVPSLRVATFESRQSAMSIGVRGIVPFDANQTARDQGVGVYIDGVYLGRQQGLNAALMDIQRIEVLRGPQGTLFGRNTEGGAVSIVTREPTGEGEARITGGVGNYGSYSTEAHVDFPAMANVSVKVDGLVQHQDATVTNPLEGQTGWNYKNDAGGRISAKWEPTDEFTALFSYDRVKDENTPMYSQLYNYNPTNKTVGQYDSVTLKLVAPGSPAGTSTVCATCIAPLSPLVKVYGDSRQETAEIGVVQQPSVDNTDGFTMTLKYKMTPEMEVRSISAWRSVDAAQWDNSGGPHRTIFAPNTNFSRYSLSNLEQTQFSQELQLVGSTPRIDYVLGAYYFEEDAAERAATPTTNKWNVDGTSYSINSPVVNGTITSSNQGWDPRYWFIQRNSQTTSKSTAAFAQATWSATDSLHLTVGGRYTKDTRDGALTMVSGVVTPWKLDYSDNRVDPMVTLAWDATNDINLYAKYSTGFRAGGANSRSSNFGAFGPEEVDAYEVGAKMELFENSLRVNLAAYSMDRTGTQIDFDHVDTNPYLLDGKTPNPTFNLHTEDTGNAPGTSKIRGVEAELVYRATDNLTLGASYAYTDVSVPATLNPQSGALTQVFVVFTPKNAYSAYADYHVAMNGGARLQFHVDANAADETYSFQSENVLTDSSFVVNARIGLMDIPVGKNGQVATVSLWSRNLLDESYVYRRSNANNGSLGAYVNLNPPRTYGLSVGYTF